MNLTRTLISLAVLQTNYDNKMINGSRVGYIENFVLLSINLVKHKQNDFSSISLEDLRTFNKSFYDFYGLNIPIIILRTILARATKLDFFTKQNHELIPNYENINKELPKETMPKDNIRDISMFILNIKSFIEDKYKKEYRKKEIESALIKLLTKHEEGLFYLISDDIEKKLLPSVDIIKNKQLELDYLIYKYILSIEQNDNLNFKIFKKILIGFMLLNSIVYTNKDETKGNINDVNVYLDTKIVLRLLGMEGDRHQEHYKEFLNYIKNNSNKLKLYIFDKHYDELVNILENAKNSTNGNAFKSSVKKHFDEKNYTVSDIEKIMNNLENMLRDSGIEIFNNYVYIQDSDQYQIDELGLQKDLEQRYNSNNGRELSRKTKDSIETDATVIAQLIRLQKNHIASNFSKIKNILLTTNIILSLEVQKLEKAFNTRKTKFIPSCITDFYFFSQIWMNSQHSINTNGDITSFISNVFLTFEADEKLYKEYYNKVKILKDRGKVTEEEYRLLCSSQITNSILEEKTLCNYENIDDKLPFEILEEIKHNARKDLEIELENKEKELEIANLQAELNKKVHNKIIKKTERCNTIIYLLLKFIIFIFIFLLIYYSTFSEDNDIRTYCMFALTLLSIFGFTLTTKIIFLNKLSKKICEFLWE
ncbi:hypothetical protein FE243_07015 [Aliarcobacter thereius]|uniref:Uncharacterized protein n=1 Tax=Aliarcobacter thereius TaxID=544718 RepID=A0A5R9H1N0_9BACT|nr:hypothetical protein [Aliarcobacter thereius]TLS71040.1 hypothetical protein FE246_08740 [Aliarcobacter thereius]TLT06644.1 hypothetical protein FE243_07015 [Aliarcobacter thereius]